MTTYTKYKADAGFRDIKPVEIVRETTAFQKNLNDAKQTVVYWEAQIEKFTHKYKV